MITIYSTCQGEGIKHYLRYYIKSDSIVVVRNYQLVFNKNPNELDNFRRLLRDTTIFIYQEMPTKWDVYSTDSSVKNNVLSYLPNQCIKIAIPYVFASWYWGIGKTLLRDVTYNFDKIDDETESRTIYYNKDVIVSMKQIHNLDSILRLYDDNKINFKYEERMNNEMNILRLKETTTDVKVSDFILKNYKKTKLFLTPNHPSHVILIEIARQILEKLNVDVSEFYKMTETDVYNLGGDWTFSTHDKTFHNFEFNLNCDDNAVKETISELCKY